jgi:hypothetical protein
MGILGRISERIQLRLMTRDEYESAKLRAYFQKRYNIRIGLYTYGCFDRWRVPPGTVMGRYCSFAPTARILDANHPFVSLSTHPYLYEPSFGIVRELRIIPTQLVIEDDVWVGHNAILTPRVHHVGRGAVIGAGSVVTKNVPPYAIMAGNPARMLRSRFDEKTIARIEASKWWELDKDALRDLVKSDPDFVFFPTRVVRG